MPTSLKLTLTALCFLFLISCDNNKTNEEADQAFTEYRDFVTETENEANTEYSEIEIRAMKKSVQDTSLWQTESAELMQQYEERESRMRDNFNSYDEARQAEIEDLDARYTSAVEKRERKYQDVSRRYKLREELLGLPISADDLSTITAAEIGPTYSRFVDNLEDIAADLDQRGWNHVEGWWVSLNNRKTALEAELTADANNTIRQATERYLEIRKRFATPA